MAIKKFVLVKKSDHSIVYGGQVFQYDDTVQSSPVGLLGGWGQKAWYWNEVTSLDASYFTDGRFNKTIRTPDVGETIDPNAENEIIPNGTWA